MSMSEDKTSVLVNMNKELKNVLKQLAEKDNRSLTGYIVNVLKKHVENKDK